MLAVYTSLTENQQLAKINNSSLNTTHSARNLGFIFDEHLTFSDQIFALSKSCYSHIRQLCCIRPFLDSSFHYYSLFLTFSVFFLILVVFTSVIFRILSVSHLTLFLFSVSLISFFLKISVFLVYVLD